MSEQPVSDPLLDILKMVEEETLELTIAELSAIRAALALYKVGLEKTDPATLSAKGRSVHETTLAATGTAQVKIVGQLHKRGAGVY